MPPQTHSFDLVRLAHCKRVLGIAESCVREYERQGFGGIYKKGKARFVSKAELEAWIKQSETKVTQ